MVESAREVCGSVKVGGGTPKSVWWNDEVIVAVKRKEMLGDEDECKRDMSGSFKRRKEKC